MLVLIAIPSFAYASPSLNMTLNPGQTTPAVTVQNSGGNILWQFITNTFGNIATLISQKIVIYNSGLTHIRGYQLPDANTTLAGQNTSNTFSGNNKFTGNNTVIGTITITRLNMTYNTNPYAFINSINKTNGGYYGVNTTSSQIQFTNATDFGFMMNQELTALGNKGGIIHNIRGNYTVTTPIKILGDGITFEGEGLSDKINGAGTNIRCNVTVSFDCISIGQSAPNITTHQVYLKNLIIYRIAHNSAHWLISLVSQRTFDTVLENIVTIENNHTTNAEITEQGGDVTILNHVEMVRTHASTGNESSFFEAQFSGGFHTWILNSHFGASGYASTNYGGVDVISPERTMKMTDTTFDSLGTANNAAPLNIRAGTQVQCNGCSFFNNGNNNYPKIIGNGIFSGTYQNLANNAVFTTGNFTSVLNYTSISTFNNFTDSHDTSKNFKFTGTNAFTHNHVNTYTVPNANGTLSLQPVFNFTSPSNQTGISSTSLLLNGAYVTLTPRYSGNATVAVQGSIYNSVAGSGCVVSLRTSNAFLGTNGLAATGSQVGNDFKYTSGTAQANGTLSLDTTVTGMTPGQKNYFDLAMRSITSGYCKIINLNWNIREQ